MNAKVIISTILLLFVISVSAQDNENNYVENSSGSKPTKESLIRYGLKFGFDMQPLTLNTKEMIDQLQNGYQAGLFLQIGKRLYFQPELYYASFQNPTSSMSAEKIQSIRAPILLGLRVIDLGIVSAHLMGGPVFSASLSDISEGMKLNEFTRNWQLGVGVDIIGFITADIRYSLIKGVEITDQFSNFNPETSMLNVTVGIKLK